MNNLMKVLFRRGTLIAAATIMYIGILIPAVTFGADGSVQQGISSLEEGQTLDGPGFFTGSTVRVDGNVEGTTFASGQDVTINGNISGDLIVAAQTVTVNGKVSGNIYAAGQYVAIQGSSAGDAFLAAQDVTVGSASEFGRDLFAGGSKIMMEGSAQRDFHGSGDTILINGTIGRDVSLDGASVVIADHAVIKGDLAYKSEVEASIATGSKIGGSTDWTYIDRTPQRNENMPGNMMGGKVLGKVLGIAGILLVWFLIRIWRPEAWKKTTDKVMEQPVKTLGIGAIAFIVTPILTLLLFITVIGIPAGILIMIAYSVSLYLSKIIAAVLLGSWLARRFGWREIHKGIWLFLLGLVILTLLCMVPILKILVWLVIIFLGLGSIISVNLRTDKKTEEIQSENG